MNDGDELPVAGGIKILHTPGHTPGSICIFLRQKGAVMTGDLLAQRSGIKLPSMPFTVDVAQEYDIYKQTGRAGIRSGLLRPWFTYQAGSRRKGGGICPQAGPKKAGTLKSYFFFLGGSDKAKACERFSHSLKDSLSS